MNGELWFRNTRANNGSREILMAASVKGVGPLWWSVRRSCARAHLLDEPLPQTDATQSIPQEYFYIDYVHWKGSLDGQSGVWRSLVSNPNSVTPLNWLFIIWLHYYSYDLFSSVQTAGPFSISDRVRILLINNPKASPLSKISIVK